MARFVGYIRVSAVRGRSGESFVSPDVQRDAITHWAKAHGHTIGEFFTDLDQSGGKLTRPEFDKALGMIESKQADGIVVRSLDRFSRAGIAPAIALIENIEAKGGIVASVKENIDTSSELGGFIRNIFLSIAEMERIRIRNNWNEHQERAVERGIHIAAKPPTGYDWEGDAKRLIPNADAPHVTHAFRMKAAGSSMGEIGRYFLEQGVRTPYGNEQWMRSSLRGVIENRVYLGEARGGKFKNEGAHEALIDRATWELAQTKQADRKARSGDGALLQGILRCASCRYVMQATPLKRRNGVPVIQYRCRRTHAAGKCPGPITALATAIEPFVVSQFFAGYDAVTAPMDGADVEELEAALRDAEAALSAYVKNVKLIGIIGEEAFNEGAAEHQRAVEDATRALRNAAPASGDDVDVRSAWDEWDVKQKRRALKAAIDAVVLFPANGSRSPIEDRAVVLAAGDMPDDFPGPGRRNMPIEPYRP